MFVSIAALQTSIKDAQHSDDLNSVSWCDLIREVSVAGEEESPRHFSSGDELRRLLKFERLVVHIFATIGNHAVGVELAALLIEPWILRVVASTRNRDTSEALRNLQLLLMTTILALNSHLGSSNSGSACVGDDAGDDNHLSYEVTLKFSQHARDFIAVNLHLEQGNRVSLLELLAEIVSFINLLNCFLELNRYCYNVL